MISKFIIYALIDPNGNHPRYVGQSSSGLERYRQHLKGLACRDGCRYKKFWVQQLLDRGDKPGVVILLSLPGPEYLDAAERFWIAELRARGCELTNLTDGGVGTRGWRATQETRDRMSASQKGHLVSQEQRDAISKTLTGRPTGRKGLPMTPAAKAAHQLAHAIPPFQDQHGRAYTTIKEAAERWKLAPGNICNVLKGKRKSTGGLIFTYKDTI